MSKESEAARELAAVETELALLDPGTHVTDAAGNTWLRRVRYAAFELLREDGTPTGLVESPRALVRDRGPITTPAGRQGQRIDPPECACEKAAAAADLIEGEVSP